MRSLNGIVQPPWRSCTRVIQRAQSLQATTSAQSSAESGPAATLDELLAGLLGELRAGDHALLMSNGGFGGLHQKLLDALAARG